MPRLLPCARTAVENSGASTITEVSKTPAHLPATVKREWIFTYSSFYQSLVIGYVTRFIRFNKHRESTPHPARQIKNQKGELLL